MSAIPDWMIGGLSAEEYDDLPEEVCRTIEVIDGAVVVSPSPTRRHQDVVRRLANAIEAACSSDLAVTIDVDLRLSEVPLLNRRPDVVVYRADVPADQVLQPADVVLVVEVSSPGSVLVDRYQKPAEYATVSIPAYWRVSPEQGTVWTYELAPAGNAYQLAGEHKGRLTVSRPVSLDVELAGLLRG